MENEKCASCLSNQSKPEAKLDCVAELEFVKGTGGMIGGHWAGWRVDKII